MQALGLVWGNLDPKNANLDEVRTQIPAPTQYGGKLLLEDWAAQTAKGGFVVGRDVPSRRLAPVLRNIAIFEPIEGMTDFRMRLAGTAFMRRFGRDVTRLKLSEMYSAADFERQRRNLIEVIHSSTPDVAEVKIMRDRRAFLRFEMMQMPVLSPDRTAGWVMGALFYSDWT